MSLEKPRAHLPFTLIHVLAAGVAALCLFTFAEWAAKLWIRSRGDGLARARLILEPDAELGWHQRPNQNTYFEGVELQTNDWGFRGKGEIPPRPKVLVMGPSSTFGWAVSETESYSGQLRLVLNRPGASPAAVINAGEIGFSLVQGRKLYEQLRARGSRYLAKYVVLAYGVNDLDHFRFFGPNGPTDHELFLQNQSPLRLRTAKSMNAFALSGLFERAWEESEIYRHCGLVENPKLRTPNAEFEQELRSFIDRIRADGATPILLNTPFYNRRPGMAGDAERCDALYAASERASKRGACAESRQLFFAARKLEPARLERDVKKLNILLQEIARSTKAELVDLTWLVKTSAPERNFVDAVHPSALANRQIGEILARVIEGGQR